MKLYEIAIESAYRQCAGGKKVSKRQQKALSNFFGYMKAIAEKKEAETKKIKEE